MVSGAPTSLGTAAMPRMAAPTIWAVQLTVRVVRLGVEAFMVPFLRSFSGLRLDVFTRRYAGLGSVGHHRTSTRCHDDDPGPSGPGSCPDGIVHPECDSGLDRVGPLLHELLRDATPHARGVDRIAHLGEALQSGELHAQVVALAGVR